MRKIAIILILSFIPVYELIAQSNAWRQLGPTGGTVMDIQINPSDNQTVFLGTVNNPYFFKSSDGGNLWIISPDANQVLSSIRKLECNNYSPETMYCSTARGMFRSIDGGVTWSIMTPPGYPYNEIRGLAVHPRYPNIIYAGGPFGNKWRSSDGGNTWSELNTSGRIIGIDDFAIDPVNDSIAYFVSGSMRYRLGVWKTTDLGLSWFTVHNNMDTLGWGEKVTVDPINHQNVYVVKNSIDWPDAQCVYKSTDGGASWRGITPPQLNYRWVKDIDVLPANNSVLYICSANEGVFKSEDGGLSWRTVNNGLNVLWTKTLEIDTVAGILYLGTYYDGIYKSTDWGESWQKISNNINLSSFWDIAYHPQDSSRFFIIGVISYYTTDLGRNWSVFAPSVGPLQYTTALEIDRYDPNRLYLTTADVSSYSSVGQPGFYYSSDGGATWERRVNGLPLNMSCRALQVSYAGGNQRRLFLTANRGLYYSDDFGENWQLCSGGVLPTNEYLYELEVSLANENYVAVATLYSQVYLSFDRGNSWSAAASVPSSNYFRDFAFDPVDSNTLYLSCSDSGLLRSVNAGTTWVEIGESLPYSIYRSVSAICINPLNNSEILVTTHPFGVYRTNDGGLNWYSFNTGIDTIVSGGVMTFVPGDTNSILLASSNHSVWLMNQSATRLIENASLPSYLCLQIYPNPFNAATTFSYSLPSAMPIKLDIYDLLGRRLSTLYDGIQQAGQHSLRWDAADMPSGIYFYRLTAGDESKSGKAVLLR